MSKRWIGGMLALILAFPSLAGALPEEDSLRLSPGQARALRTIRSRFEGRLQDLQMRLEERRLELAQMIRSDNADKATVKAKLDEIINLERERQQLFVDQLFEAKGQLSRAQWGPFRQKVLRHLLQERRMGARPQRLGSDPTSP
ncbi:MAG: periplasmic heavy metal sensor [Vulcanimicrobiota bacterium]